MNKFTKIAVTMDDGTLTILTFATESRSPTLPSGAEWIDKKAGVWTRAPSVENVNAELAKAFPPVNGVGKKNIQPVTWVPITDAELPGDRVFRGAWVYRDGKVEQDIDKAKEIQRDRIRRDRVTAMQELDAEWMKATGTKDQKAADDIEAERQKWRDAPADPRIDAATTVEELKAIKLDI